MREKMEEGKQESGEWAKQRGAWRERESEKEIL